MRTLRFNGQCYNYKKYGHRSFECRSKPMWTPNQLARRNNHGHHYKWDYNTKKIYHYYQEYWHVPKNCIRTHFRGNYNRWLSQTTCFSCLKTAHISKYCPTRSKVPSCEFDKGKSKVDVEHIKDEMKRHGRKRMIVAHQMEKGSLHPMGQVITPHQTRKSRGMWD